MSYSLHNSKSFAIYPLNENAVTLQFEQHISDVVLAQISAFNKLLTGRPFSGMLTTVPAYATLTVFYDVFEVMRSAMPGETCYEKVSGYLRGLQLPPTQFTQAGSVVTIPVCYGQEFGPDINDVAKYNQITVQEVIEIHTAAIYKVFMVGFVPGFAYLGGMDTRLATPRKATPRQVVPAGAVGIAGQQTGIYPSETPGGWQLIGQTPLCLFDAKRSQPSLLQAGDEVTFQAISYTEFQSYTA